MAKNAKRNVIYVLVADIEDCLQGIDSLCVVTDIGTTTIAMELYSAGGEKKAEHVCPNPQRIFGADVIFRIQATENPMNSRLRQALIKKVSEEGLQELKRGGTYVERMWLKSIELQSRQVFNIKINIL